MRALSLALLAVSLGLACKKDPEQVAPTALPPAPSAEPAAAAPAPRPTIDGAAERIAARLGELATAANCSQPDSAVRNWCLVAQGWAAGTAAELPVGGTALLGVTLTLGAEQTAAAALAEPPAISVLALRNEGGKATAQASTIDPSSPAEKDALAQAAFNLALVVKGQAESAAVPAPLVEFIGSLPGAASNPVVAGGGGWRFETPEPVELRRVGDAWVAVRLLPDDAAGLALTAYTDRFEPL
jgi:hypothetical protein